MLANLLLTDSQVGVLGFFLGVITVFLGITLLIFVVWVMGKIFSASTNSKKEEEVTPEPAPVVEAVDDGGIPEHVKVAIVAAIMAFYEQQNEKCEFTIKKIARRRENLCVISL